MYTTVKPIVIVITSISHTVTNWDEVSKFRHRFRLGSCHDPANKRRPWEVHAFLCYGPQAPHAISLYTAHQVWARHSEPIPIQTEEASCIPCSVYPLPR